MGRKLFADFFLFLRGGGGGGWSLNLILPKTEGLVYTLSFFFFTRHCRLPLHSAGHFRHLDVSKDRPEGSRVK
jgi:hypothetical protein